MGEPTELERVLAALDSYADGKSLHGLTCSDGARLLRKMDAERRALREALAEVMQVHDSNRGEYFMHDALVRDIRALLAPQKETKTT